MAILKILVVFFTILQKAAEGESNSYGSEIFDSLLIMQAFNVHH